MYKENLANNIDYSWSIDLSTRQFKCSDWILEVCGLNPENYDLQKILLLVKPEHKNRVQKSIDTLYSIGRFEDVSFQILTQFGYRWARAHSYRMEQEKGKNTRILGYFDFLEKDELDSTIDNKEPDDASIHKSSISDTLMELLYGLDKSSVIQKTLGNLLDEFSGDRAYIFQYNHNEETQSCTYEATRSPVFAERENLQEIPFEDTPWWSEMLYHRSQPIIFSNICDLPPQANSEYEILNKQDIKSIMVVPLMVKKGVGGYMGIDIVTHQRNWNKTDQQRFRSLANIISLCIELKKSEETALIEREHYRKLYQTMPMGFIRLRLIYDEQGKPIDFIHEEINAVGEAIAKACGEENVLNRLNSEILHPISEEKLQTIDQLIQTHQVFSRQTFKLGRRYFDYTLYSVEGNEIIVLIKDSTESVANMHALRKSEETFQNIYNNVPIGIEIYDRNGVLIDINNVELDIFGLESKEQALGVNMFENPNLPQSFLDDLRNNKPAWCDFFYDFDKVDSYYASKCNGLKHIVLKGTIVYDFEQNIENYILIVIDNTETLRASHKIREFEILFNSIAEFAEVGLCQWNYHTKSIMGTEQWFLNQGQTNRQISDIMEAYTEAHEEDKERLRERFEEIISGQTTSFREEIRIKQQQGYKWLNILFKVSDHTPQENHFEIIGINIDITTLKQTEVMLIQAKQKAEESDNLKSAFLANMSHEIRTPLNAIVGFSELLTDTDIVEERQEYLSIIRKNNDLLLQLISDILDISKIESGMVDIHCQEVDIQKICSEIVYTNTLKTTDKVNLLLESQTVECTLHTDQNRLIQILSNLINNAIKFTPEGTIAVGYHIEGTEVRFYVRDTGIGMTEEQITNIFSRFIKFNTFITGTGLGLSICKSLIEKMGGRIWVESIYGQGSCFFFTLPLGKA